MTDDEIRTVFAELRRIGVDLGRPPGLALGTGFRDGEFAPWLRTLPDNLGHDVFVDTLNAYIAAAAPNAAMTDTPPNDLAASPRRFWPTAEQVGAVTAVLIREWDPLGARLGNLLPEDVGATAFNAANTIVRADASAAVESRISTMLASVERDVFGLRPSPKVQRRYLARRMIQEIAANPGPAHDFDPWERMREVADHAAESGQVRRVVTATSMRVCFGPQGDEPSALDLQAVCDECGATGTVAFVTRYIDPPLSRFCVDCWRRVRHKFWWPANRRIDADTPEGAIAAFDRMYERVRESPRVVGSAMWEDRLDFVRAALSPNEDQSPADRERHLRRLARELADAVPKMYGPMPPEIEAFVKQYSRHDA